MPFLIADVHSNFNHKVHGKTGEEIKVIRINGSVAIVEDKKGYRFSCMTDNISEAKEILEAEPGTKAESIIINRVPVPKTKAAPLNNKQSKLF